MRPLAVAVLVAAVAAGVWFGKDSPAVRRMLQSTGLQGGDATPATGATLAAAGVHKCEVHGGIIYLDRPCPRGSRELAANGGTVTVVSFPKAEPPPAAAASGVLGSPIVKGLSREEIDRLRDKQIEDAANR